MCGQTSQVSAILTQASTAPRASRNLYVETGAPSQLPYASNFVDMVLITGLADADLAGIPIAEVTRVLGPGGKAFIGRATSEGAGLSSSALTAWANGTSSVAISTTQGTWAVVTKGKLRGSDEWPCFMHGTDNNPVSSDSLIKWPFLPQWRQRPNGCNRWGAVVAAGGRTYTMRNHFDDGLTLMAFRIANGSALWSKTLLQIDGKSDPSPMIATQTGLYLAQGNTIVELDGETGTTVHTWTVEPVTANRLKWIVRDGSMFYAFSGSPANDNSTVRPVSKLWAYNTVTQSSPWSKTFSGQINARDVGFLNGRIFLYATGQGVMCISASDGSTVWTQNSSTVSSMLETQSCVGWCELSTPYSSMLCTPNTIYIHSTEDAAAIALRNSDGAIVWSSAGENYGRCFSALVHGTTFVSPYVQDNARKYVDINTNAAVPASPLTSLAFGNDGCGVKSAVPDGIFGNAGGQASSFSLNKNLGHSNIKTDCGIGVVFSDGTAITPSTGCNCYPIRGNIATVSAGSFVFNQSAVQAQRHEQGPAYGGISAQVNPDNQDWWTYRGNQRRNGSTSVTVNASRLKWTYTPPQLYDTTFSVAKSDEFCTPPVSAGDFVYWSGTDGVVRCVNSTSGTLVWSYPTGAAVYAAPTVSAGCVYVGSSDGHVYCNEAHTGRLVWRFRAAPDKRLINIYGHLSSSWPVNCGISVNNGVVFFTAGLMDEYGVHTYALNATTGAIVWQNNTAGSLVNAEFRNGFTPGGFTTVVGNRFWAKSIEGRSGTFNLATGAIDPYPSQCDPRGYNFGYPQNYGREVMVLDDTHVMYGGHLQYSEFTDFEYNSRKRTYSVVSVDAQGMPLFPEITVMLNSTTAPAWDATDMFVWLQDGGWGTAWTEKWSTAAYIKKVDDTRAANSGAKDVQLDGFPNAASQPAPTALCSDGWLRSKDEVYGIALGANAVCLAAQEGERWVSNGKRFLAIMRRTAADSLYKYTLPARPVQSGVAINRNGEVIVTLQSGQVVCYGSSPVSVAQPREAEMALPAFTGTLSVPSRTTSFAIAQAPAVTPASVPAVAHRGETSGEATHASVEMAADDPSTNGTTSGCKPQKAEPAMSCNAVAAAAQGRLIPVAPRSADERVTLAPAIPAGLTITTVTASSSKGANLPSNTIDRRATTRWSPGKGGNQWITFDLGSSLVAGGFSFQWYSRNASVQRYVVEVSSDGVSYAQIGTGALARKGSGVSHAAIGQREVRFIRVTFPDANVRNALSVYEAGVYDIGFETARVN